jgi:hypothetical protein
MVAFGDANTVDSSSSTLCSTIELWSSAEEVNRYVKVDVVL